MHEGINEMRRIWQGKLSADGSPIEVVTDICWRHVEIIAKDFNLNTGLRDVGQCKINNVLLTVV
jgi:hypothetical protein